jgi:hypothetical protein
MIFDNDYIWLFLITLPFVALLYASVGHGGASGYLALMALFSFAPEIMRPTALLLNLFVAGIAFYHYYRLGYFNKKLFFSFALSSIPFAFAGSMIEIDAGLYKKTLGVFLLFAILKMLYDFSNKKSQLKEVRLWQGLLLGGGIGFFSGLIGIGGGIILTPIILLFHWGDMKSAAAVSALFIWVNSGAGLIGQLSIGAEISWEAFILVAIALIGGFIGSYYGSKKLNNSMLRYILAFVLTLASIKLFLV